MLMYHYSLEFPTPLGVGEIKSDKEINEKYRMKIYTKEVHLLLFLKFIWPM